MKNFPKIHFGQDSHSLLDQNKKYNNPNRLNSTFKNVIRFNNNVIKSKNKDNIYNSSKRNSKPDINSRNKQIIYSNNDVSYLYKSKNYNTRKQLVDGHLKTFNNSKRFIKIINDSFINKSEEFSNKYL